jgi:hypothetical protein
MMKATQAEMDRHFLTVLKHMFNVEYCCTSLGIGHSDLYQRPHDGRGPGNKLQFPVANGLALEYRVPLVDFDTEIQPSIDMHRALQYHHQMWNGPDPDDKTKPHPDALKNGGDGLYLGAVDWICAFGANGESRLSIGVAHTFEQMRERARKEPSHKIPYLLEVIPEMEKLKRLPLEQLTDIHSIPNIGVPRATYDAIQEVMGDAIEMMRRRHGYFQRAA